MTELVFKNRALFYFILLAMVAGGIFSFITMSKLEDPEIEVKQALVATFYPGASALETEKQVTDVIEESIQDMGGLNYIESRSKAGYSEITVELHPTVTGDDIEQKWDILRRRVEAAYPDLPRGAQDPLVMDDFGDVFGLFYAMTASEGFSYEEMNDYARKVKSELEAIEDVRRVQIYGDRSPAVYINADQTRMANLGIPPLLLFQTLEDQDETVYAGHFETPRERIRVDVSDNFKSKEDIENLVLQGFEGDRFRLSEIAEVERGLEEPYREAMRHNKKKALGISIAMESGGSVIALGRETDEKLEKLQTTLLPAGIDFNKVFFQPEKVSSAITTFMVNLVMSVMIVIVILMFTMGLRSGVIIGSGLFLTILGSFVILSFFDGTLQRVSLSSFIVTMGMLVDNAIVIVDGILTDLQKGMKKEKALVNTVNKTAWPLLGATLITIFGFLPIFLSPDTAGEYVRDLFIVLSVSLLISWLLALTQAPMMAAGQFKNIAVKNSPGNTPYNSFIYRIHKKTVKYILRHKTVSITIVVSLLCISALLFRFIPQTFFPDLTYSQLYIEYDMPSGTRIEAVDRDLGEIEDYLLEKNSVKKVTTSLGGTPARYNLVRTFAKPSMSYGELIVEFDNPDILVEKAGKIQQYLSENHPQAYARVKRYNLMYMAFPVEVMFTGPDRDVLKELTSEAVSIMEEEPSATLVTTSREPAGMVKVASYNQLSARKSGISRSDVALSMLSSTEGVPVGNLHEGEKTIPVYLKTTAEENEDHPGLSTSPLLRMMPALRLPDTRMVNDLLTGATAVEDIFRESAAPLPARQAVPEIDIEWEEPQVERYNRVRSMKARCNPASGKTADDVRNNIIEEIENIDLPPGYNLEWHGEYKASTEAREYLFMHLPLAVILIIAVLIALFGDYKKPLIIIMGLPLAFIGIVPGLLLAGKEYGFVAIVGTLGLMGMMTKNGVVLLEEVKFQVKSGKNHFDSLVEASTSRLRPVMMASLTTIMGMLPLLPDDMFGSLAATMMAGLLAGSLITLLIIPAFYALMHKVVHPESKKRKKTATTENN